VRILGHLDEIIPGSAPSGFALEIVSFGHV
jgi:hypothetical protein